MINLFINYYIDNIPERQLELNTVLLNNIQNPLIDRIMVFCDGSACEALFNKFKTEKIIIIRLGRRPTFKDFFMEVCFSNNRYPKDINIISNSDIYFDGTLKLIKEYDCGGNPNTCMALSRWDIKPDGSILHFNRHDSFDTWVFYGSSVCDIKDCDFTLGVAGCDDSITERVQRAGYHVINPSIDIKTIHLHLTGVRNYNPREATPKPYLLINPHKLSEKNITYIKMST